MNLFKHALEKIAVHYFAALFLAGWICAGALHAQESVPSLPTEEPALEKAVGVEPDTKTAFRVEKVRVNGGVELLTIFARFKDTNNTEMPMLSVLRDTLGDANPDNDRLRYVWNLSYTRASFGQKVAAFAPFLYTRTTNKETSGKVPPLVLDMTPNDNGPWNKIFRIAFRKVVLGRVDAAVRAPILQYQQNKTDYRRSAIAKTLAVLSQYKPRSRESLFRESELKDIQARLWLTDKTFGWHMQSEYLSRVYDKEIARSRDLRNQNWELLRQYSERQGLYFDPLKMPDGTTRHAILWADAADIKANADKKFDGRFLNIKNPWDDRKLLKWKGFSQMRWFNDEDRAGSC